MPVFNKMPFRRRKIDPSIKDSDKVWYIESTNEVFTKYDDYFDRYIQMNSMCWTCAITGKSNLTFDEAKESEKQAVKAVENSFPKELAVPLLWLAHTYCSRGRVDDIVNDVYVVSRGRFFIGEDVWYQKSETQRYRGRIVAVEYDEAKALEAKQNKPASPEKEVEEVVHTEEDEDAANASSSTKKKCPVIKPEDPDVPAPEAYTYSFRADDNDDTVYNQIEHDALSRPKAIGSRVKMRLFIKKLTELRGNHYIISKSTVEQYRLKNRQWDEFFVGPIPVFSHTERRKPAGIPIDQKRKAGSPLNSPSTAKRQRVSKSTGGKVKKEIQQQQDSLADIFSQAKSAQVENLSNWEQTERILSDSEVEALKEALSLAQEEKRELDKERKKREKDEIAASRKPRDDLFCDDLKPLPELKPLELPSYLTPESFSHLLAISQFFNSYSTFFEDDFDITMKDCILALYQGEGTQNDSLVKLLTALLKMRAIVVEKEDGDECNPKVEKEMTNETYAVFNNRMHGSNVMRLNKLHETSRMIHGIAPPFLTTNWTTISEVLRLNLVTSGYCPFGSVYAIRALKRGGIHCYEDPVYLHLLDDPSIADKLENLSIFDMSYDERLTLINILIEQLLTFFTIRDLQEDRVVKLPDLRRQMKHLKIWDQEQEKNARIKAYEADEAPKPKNSKEKNIVKLRNYVKAVNENRRGVNREDVRELFLETIQFEEFTADEIRDLREIQKTFVADKLEALALENFETFCKVGTGFLGRDRAFRSYHYFDQYPIILVENVKDPGECGEPTPMKSNSDDLEEIKSVMGCTGVTEDCPVHSKNRPQWLYIASENAIDELINACNPRGFREIELSESLIMYKHWLKPAVDNFVAVLKESSELMKKIELNGEIKNGGEEEAVSSNSQTEDIPKENEMDINEGPDFKERSHSKSKTPDSTKNSKKKVPVKVTYANGAEFMGLSQRLLPEDFKENRLLSEVRKMITDMISKIEMNNLGEFSFNESQTIEQFMIALNNGEDIKPYMVEADLIVHCFDEEVIYTKEKFDELPNNEVNQLLLAFVKVIHAVELKFLKEPLSVSEKDRHVVSILPTRYLVTWQQNLTECHSLSALALFISKFEGAVSWNPSRNNPKRIRAKNTRYLQD